MSCINTIFLGVGILLTPLLFNFYYQAVSAGNTSLGIKAKNGVVIASEKKLPSLMDGKSMEKLVAVCFMGARVDYLLVDLIYVGDKNEELVIWHFIITVECT